VGNLEPDSADGCPPEASLLAFASGSASAGDRKTVEAHLSSCEICRMLVSALAPTHLPRSSSPSGPTSALAVGEILEGKYQVLRVIGEGGMGQVVEAKHLTLDRSVALKFLHRSVAEDREAVMRFFREARAAAALDSEHVVRVLDAGHLPNTEEPYIVLEYLNGCDLSKLARDRGRLPMQEAVDYVLQACEALSLAHAKGIVHRDIKPANLFLTQRADGSALVKVLDFGIAKIAEATPEPGVGETSQNAIMGSPRYMAPEQLRSSKHVDARADVWAMGVTLFELLGGRAPFVAESVPALCAAIFGEEPPTLSSVRPDLPEALSDVVMASLRKDPVDRTASMADFAKALAPFAGAKGAEIAERARRVSGCPPAAPAYSSSSNVGGGTTLSSAAGEHPNPRSTAPPKPTRQLWPIIAATAAVVGGLWGAWTFTQTDSAVSSEEASSPAAHAPEPSRATEHDSEAVRSSSSSAPSSEPAGAETARAADADAAASAKVETPRPTGARPTVQVTRPAAPAPPPATPPPASPPPTDPRIPVTSTPPSSSDDLLNRQGLGDRK